MSQVFSFRLDDTNPRETQAIQILEAWVSKGYSLRHVVIEAVFALEDKDRQTDFSSELKQIIDLLQELQVQPVNRKPQPNQEKRLSESFLNSITKVNRPGLRMEKTS
jgi:hypothetical protein